MLVARVKFKTKLGDFFLLAKLAISLQEKQEEGVQHSSETRGLCLIEWSNKLLKKNSEFSCFFIFPPNECPVDIDQGIYKGEK